MSVGQQNGVNARKLAHTKPRTTLAAHQDEARREDGVDQQGATGGFRAVHVLPWGTEQDMFVFNNCIAGSSGISAKKSGFAGFTLDYMAAVDANDQLGTATFAEAA